MSDRTQYYEYFTCIVYPQEASQFTIRLFNKLGYCFISPLHSPSEEVVLNDLCTDLVSRINFGFYEDEDEDKKPHYHIMVNTGNSLTVNQFIEKWSSLFGDRCRGISINKTNCGVKKPYKMMQYFYHINHPWKQQFEKPLEHCSNSCNDIYIPICSQAFDNYIRYKLTDIIRCTSCKTVQDLMLHCDFIDDEKINPKVLSHWLCLGRNLYFVNTLLKENR